MTDITKFPFSNLSKQQKAILEIIYEYTDEHHTVTRSKEVSWKIAERFNKGHNDRIFDWEKHKAKLRKERQKRTTTTEGDKLSDAIGGFLLSYNYGKFLTNKHSASMSRSVKRLIERGLIKGFDDSEVGYRTPRKEKRVRYIYPAQKGHKLGYLGLTDKGREWCEKKSFGSEFSISKPQFSP